MSLIWFLKKGHKLNFRSLSRGAGGLLCSQQKYIQVKQINEINHHCALTRVNSLFPKEVKTQPERATDRNRFVEAPHCPVCTAQYGVCFVFYID